MSEMMKGNIAYLLVWVCISLVVGCGSSQEKKAAGYLQASTYKNIDFKNLDTIKDRLYTQYNEWRGVRYRFGGLSRRGIDCSGFVQVTFMSKFGLNLPRTTHYQSKLGKKISKTELQAGDLVFFRIGRNSRHVGIYLEKGKFLHASSSKGVTISRLSNVYWKANYWKSIRI